MTSDAVRHPTGRGRIRWWATGLLCSVLLLSGCGAAQVSADGHHETAVGTAATQAGPARRHTPHRRRHHGHHGHHAAAHHHPAPKQRRHRHHRTRVGAVPRVDLPNHRLTPGVVATTSTAKVCTPGYASSVRDVPSSESDAVYARYHTVHVPYAHEVDHLVSLELGGSNAIGNLWPEPYAGRWGARTKDVLENRLHDLVCSGALPLRTAQRLEAANWVAAYHRFVGGPPPVSSGPAAPSTAPGPPPQTGNGSCEPGYSPCLPVTSDLDCSDIPDADKPVHVTGSDPYRLDGDGDGYGCE